MVIDIRRAHFYAPALRRIFVQLPPEDPRSGEEGVCAEFVQAGLNRFRMLLEAHDECKVESIGPGPDDAKELRVLGRMVRFTKGGCGMNQTPGMWGGGRKIRGRLQ